jgi:NitT/TauT family transport system permease protein
MLIHEARAVQVWILVIFTSTWLITSLLSVFDSLEEELNHARTLGCRRWEVLWEVVILGKLDYVLESIRQNVAIVWMMLVTVESILASAGGLGFLIKQSDKLSSHGRLMALQIIILLIGLGLDYAITALRKLMFKYTF